MSAHRFPRLSTILLASAAALLSVACGAGEEGRSYSGLDADRAETAETGLLACEAGELRDCTIWLGRHGDLSNCVHGLEVCGGDGSWSECVDEQRMSDEPELYAELSSASAEPGEAEAAIETP